MLISNELTLINNENVALKKQISVPNRLIHLNRYEKYNITYVISTNDDNLKLTF